MMTSLVSSPRIWSHVSLLAVASVALSSGFACAVPLAAFAAIAAIHFARRDALFATFAVWLVNQLFGIAVLHYPLDATTLVWGATLGILALFACEAARMAYFRSNVVGASGAFLAAFSAYEGALIAIDVMTGQSAEYYSVATVTRVFLINACAFGALRAAHALFPVRRTGVAAVHGAGLQTAK